MSFDLGSLDTVTRAEEGAEYEARNPKTGKGVGLFIKVFGADSKKYKNAFKEAMKKAAPDATANDIKQRVFIETVISWRAVDRSVFGKETPTDVMLDGKAVNCTPETLRQVCDRMPTIKDQGVAFQEDRANFLPTASGN